ALLGQTSQYQPATATTTFDAQYYNFEFYVQDNWKVGRRLTLDLGVRFYHQTPQYDLNKTFVNFVSSTWSSSAVPRLYQPHCSNGAVTCTSANTLVAFDPVSGDVQSSGYIGQVVIGSGDYLNGVHVLGVNGVDQDPYKTSPIAV